MVAMFGDSIAAPFAMPPTTKPSPSITTCLAWVSVVMIALAAASPPSVDRAATSAGTAAVMTSIGMGIPMSPVEHTRICSGATPSSDATAAHMASASSMPGAPVAALALPLLRMTATDWPPERSRCVRVVMTGAAVIRLRVNTPAADTGCASVVATRERSGAPDALMPAAIPAATNPDAAVTLMGRPRRWRGRSPRADRRGCWRTARPDPRRPW